jgi:glycosyltransferase involved in cell wall biosynthesis
MFRVIVSAVNLTEGGPLTVLRECLVSASSVLPDNYEIIALVNSRDLVSVPRVRFMEFPSAKKSWFIRIFWEWIGFWWISRDLKPLLWLSLHDITPRVLAERQAVYCHNPSPFYTVNFRESIQDPSFFLFNRLYAVLYRLFIRRNHCVIVQQDWIRTEFVRRFGNIPVVVAHPSLQPISRSKMTQRSDIFIFIFPTFPRVFKNIETLCTAASILMSRGCLKFEVRVTLDGRENKYARWILNKFAPIKNIKFIGRQTKEDLILQYCEASALVFPSKLETWGLPITEAKMLDLPLLVADLPYAKETVGNYDRVSFFPAESSLALADLMQSMIEGTWQPSGNRRCNPGAPFASNWSSLWSILIGDSTKEEISSCHAHNVVS